jgi:hypothetical protein
MNILKDADEITSGSRNKAYGSPLENHTRTSRLWKEYLDAKFGTDIELNADDVCYLNILQKMSRSMHDPNHRDTWLDIAGYARNLEMMRENPVDDDGLNDIIVETFCDIEQLKPSRAAGKRSGFVYLACPYTEADESTRHWRANEAAKAAAHQMELGNVVFSPITHGHYISQVSGYEGDHSFWMAQCMPFLSAANELVVLQLPGWHESKGVAAELVYAQKHGIPISFIGPVGR